MVRESNPPGCYPNSLSRTAPLPHGPPSKRRRLRIPARRRSQQSKPWGEAEGRTPWSARNVQDSNLRNPSVQPLSRRSRSTTPTTFRKGKPGGRIEREKSCPASLVLLMGFGPTTIRLEVGSSIQLSYRNGKNRGRPTERLERRHNIERRKHATTDDRATPCWPCFRAWSATPPFIFQCASISADADGVPSKGFEPITTAT